MYISFLPPCEYRFGVVKHGKPMIKCRYKNEVVDIKECLKCKVPFESGELSRYMDEFAQLYDHVYEFNEDLDKPIKQILDIVEKFSETVSNLRGTPRDYEIGITLGYVIGLLVVESSVRFGEHIAKFGYSNSARFLKMISNPSFDVISKMIKEVLRDKYGIEI